MRKTRLFLLLAYAWMALSCAAAQQPRTVPPEEQTRRREAALKREIEYLKLENRRMRQGGQKAAQAAKECERRFQERLRTLETELSRLREAQAQVAAENEALKAVIKHLSADKRPPAAAPPRTQGPARPLIKVLSGNGEILSARVLAKRITDLGYRVSAVAFAPRSNFLQHTIYFAAPFKEDARRIALASGGAAVCKPLTWRSKFDLIVVAGGPL